MRLAAAQEEDAAGLLPGTAVCGGDLREGSLRSQVLKLFLRLSAYRGGSGTDPYLESYFLIGAAL